MVSLKTKIASPHDYINQLRSIITEALVSSENRQFLKKALARTHIQGYWSELQLGSALMRFGQYLLGMPPEPLNIKQYQNGAALAEVGGHWDEGKIPDPSTLAELGTLWAVLGVLEDQESLRVAAVKLANWLIHMLDHQGIPMQGIWAKTTSFPQLLAYLSLLFSLSFSYSGEERFQRAAGVLRPLLKSVEIPELPKLLSRFLSDRQVVRKPVPLSPFLEESVLGMAKASGRGWTAMGALSGFNTGLAAFHKQEVACLACGPQRFPLDDVRGFGIERPCSLEEKTFSDVVWEKMHQGFILKGWTKVFAMPLWLEIGLCVQNGEMALSVLKEEDKEGENLYFAFFIRAEKALIGERTIQSLSLDRFEGRNSKIIFVGGKENLRLEGEGDMEVIPLSGGDFFWGADFLVAYSLDPALPSYHWTIK